MCAPTTANPARLAPRGRQSSAGSCLHPALVLGSGLALPAGRILLPRALPGCTDPFTIQHPFPKVTLEDRSTSNKLPSILKALTLVPVGRQEADGPLTAPRATRS